MSLSLAYCLVIAPINILLKSLKTSWSLSSTFSTSSDSEITSGRINLETDEWYKPKVEWCNIWISGSLACRKILKSLDIGIANWTNIANSSLTGSLNAFINLFSLLGFSSGSFSLWPSTKSKLDRNHVSKESHCINIFSNHFEDLATTLRRHDWLPF